MALTPSQAEILRSSIIAQCAAAGATGLPLHTIRYGAKLAGFQIEDADLERHLHYLTCEDMLSVSGAAVSAALKRWTIEAKGVRYAEERGLI